MLETRELLSTVVPGFTLDNSGNLYKTTGAQPQLIDTGVQSFAVANNRVCDLHTGGVLYSMNGDGSGKVQFATGVETLIQSRSGAGVPVALLLDNGHFQESPDGATLSTIDLGGPLTQLAQGQDAEGNQVLFALRQDGTLLRESSTGVTAVAFNVKTLLQARHGNGAPCILILAAGQLQQSDDGTQFSTIDLSGPLSQIALGQDTAGNPVLFALRQDGTLLRDGSTGVSAVAFNVQTLLQGQHGNGAPCVLILTAGQWQESDDGTQFGTIDLGGPVTGLAQSQDASGNPLLFALRQDGTLLRDSSTGVTAVAFNVQTLLQSHHGNGAPCILILAGGQLQQSDDGTQFSTIDLGGPLNQLAQSQDVSGNPLLFALRQDGTLLCDSSAGVTAVAFNVQTVLQSQHGNGTPCILILAGGQLQELDGAAQLSTIGLGGTITQIAEGRNPAGQQLIYALRSDGVLFEDAPTGTTVLATGVQTLIQSRNGAGVPVLLLLDNGQFQECPDGATLSTIDLGGTITQIAEGRNPAGQQLIYALRSDGVLFEDTPAGTFPLESEGMTTLIQTRNTAGVPCIVFLHDGQFQESDDGDPAHVSTIELGTTIVQLAEGRNGAGQQLFYALGSNTQLFEDAPTGTTFLATGVQSFAVGSDGNAYYLQNGNLYSSASNRPIGIGVEVLELDTDKSIYYLQTNGQAAGAFYKLNTPNALVTGVAAYAVDNWGRISFLAKGQLWHDDGFGPYVVDSGVASFTLRSDGSLFYLKGGNLYRWSRGPLLRNALSRANYQWINGDVQSTVQAYAFDSTGALYFWTTDDNLYQYANQGSRIIAGSGSVYVFGVNNKGTVYFIEHGTAGFLFTHDVWTAFTVLGGTATFRFQESGSLEYNPNDF
jgi:protein-disulfide isomerase-like protein with CxxC motif